MRKHTPFDTCLHIVFITSKIATDTPIILNVRQTYYVFSNDAIPICPFILVIPYHTFRSFEKKEHLSSLTSNMTIIQYNIIFYYVVFYPLNIDIIFGVIENEKKNVLLDVESKINK